MQSTEDITSVLPLLESLRMAAVEAHQNKQKEARARVWKYFIPFYSGSPDILQIITVLS